MIASVLSWIVRRPFLSLAILAALCLGGWVLFENLALWPRGGALTQALKTAIDAKDSDKSFVARILLENYLETRTNAFHWSGIFWGCTFGAAALSAAAGLLLKFEFFVRNEGLKKDLAAALSVFAALLMTISTSGDFQRKWQANRVAAAELERTGYMFLEHDGADPRSYLSTIGDTLLRRQLAIAGSFEKPAEAAGSAKGFAAKK